MERFVVGEVWYGKIGTDYEGIEASIDRLTPQRVQVTFDRLVTIDGVTFRGTIFGKTNFLKLFEQQKNEQLNLFD